MMSLFFLRVMKGRTFLKDDAKTMTDYNIENDMKLKIVIRLVTKKCVGGGEGLTTRASRPREAPHLAIKKLFV